LFELVEPGKRRAKAHLLRIAGINAGHQRLHEPFEGLGAETPAKEVGERFVFR
jgi:hypothetical protein